MEKETVLLSTRNLGKQFHGITVLSDIHLTIRKGEIHAILGANGAGKSTLIKIIDGIYTDYTGEIYVKGRPVRPRNTEEARKLGIGMVHQELSLVNELSVAENIFLARLPKNRFGFVDFKKLYQDSERILAHLNMNLSPRETVGRLSIADKQMIEIAKMLSMNAEIILLDEPTSALSEKEVSRLFQTMKNLKNQGKGIIFITHKLEEIFAVSDRVTVLRDGKQIETLEIKEDPNQLEGKLISLMTGTEEGTRDGLYPNRPRYIGEMVLEVENFTRKGKFENVSFKLRSGEILGLSGLKGAGRTELARAIFGADPKDSGVLFLHDTPVDIKSPIDAIRHGIGMVSEDRKKEGFVGLLGIKENINLTTIRDVLNRGIISRAKEKAKARKYIGMLNIKTPSDSTPVKQLSGGNQQKVVLAKWLASNCKVLILDEPTRGIDVKAKSEIYHIMNDLAERGVALLFISSELPELMAMSDRVLVMHRGKIVNELVGENINKEAILKSIFQDASSRKVRAYESDAGRDR